MRRATDAGQEVADGQQLGKSTAAPKPPLCAEQERERDDPPCRTHGMPRNGTSDRTKGASNNGAERFQLCRRNRAAATGSGPRGNDRCIIGTDCRCSCRHDNRCVDSRAAGPRGQHILPFRPRCSKHAVKAPNRTCRPDPNAFLAGGRSRPQNDSNGVLKRFHAA